MTIVKSQDKRLKVNYDGYAQQVIARLLEHDKHNLRLFFNILQDTKTVKLSAIVYQLKPLYRITPKSIKELNKYFKKYKIQIQYDTDKKSQAKNTMIQSRDVYTTKDYLNGKPIIIKPKANCIRYHLQEHKALPEYKANLILGKTYLPMRID